MQGQSTAATSRDAFPDLTWRDGTRNSYRHHQRYRWGLTGLAGGI
jgi:hypothetical protein